VVRVPVDPVAAESAVAAASRMERSPVAMLPPAWTLLAPPDKELRPAMAHFVVDAMVYPVVSD